MINLQFSIPNNRKNCETEEKENDSEFNLIEIIQSMRKSKIDFMYSVILQGYAENYTKLY